MSHRVLIVGGGFGGLHTVQRLKRAPVEITLIDRRNFHLFQPLLYQTATGGVSPGDIASPLRHVLRKQRNVRVLMNEVVSIDVEARRLLMRNGELTYDTAVLSPGIVNYYYGNDQWEAVAPGLKTVEDALEIRKRVLAAFEEGEWERDPVRRAAWLTFVVIGGGPTGVELAGSLAELAHHTLRGEFHEVDPRHSRVILVEGAERILPTFPAKLSERAHRSLSRLGVETRTRTLARGIDANGVDLEMDGHVERIASRTVLWAAGVHAPPLSQALANVTGCPLDEMGRVIVESDLTVPGYPDVFVIGDMAHVRYRDVTLPGIAPAAIQQGKYVADVIRARLRDEGAPRPFRYFDKGMLATIGRSAAVGEFRGLHFWGFPAWLAWLLIHLVYLIEFENRILVLIQWTNTYVTRRRGSRLITPVEYRITNIE